MKPYAAYIKGKKKKKKKPTESTVTPNYTSYKRKMKK